MSELFVFTETPAPLGGHAVSGAGRRTGRRFTTAASASSFVCIPATTTRRRWTSVTSPLTDLYGGVVPDDPEAEAERVWEAARIAAGAVERGTGVVVHCVGGTGRTGTVVACALRLLGRSADEAVATVQAHRPKWPESPWQEQVVRSG